ncbi:AAA family ATPase [Flavobacterium johnsoniae]|jgi:predicted ATPase|uniref:AAA family ATPase n=1 Tax=Flavobacterium johnsoniae TaxID=986 RepID=UPI003D968344
MEKLIVKNFGPIKEAEIDLTKYVVFIGDTSTGKSVLAKLISIFRDGYFLSLNSIEDFELDFKNQLVKYNIDFKYENSEIIYYDENEPLVILKDNKIDLVNKNQKKEVLENLEEIHKENLSKNLFAQQVDFDKKAFFEYIQDRLFQELRSLYIPAERILFSLIGDSMAGLISNNVALPECYKEFASKFEVARKKTKLYSYNDFNIEYNFEDGNNFLTVNKTKLLLSQASSGIQSILPLLLVFDNVISNHNLETSKLFIIEEPELNLFPIKQKKLVDYLISKVKKISHKIIITTHSPYVLSSLDTLMLAKNTFDEHPHLKEKISSIVSEDKWVDYNDISVYEVRNDGKVYSIKNEEFRSIDTNAIDGVSDIISEEFDKLTELRYAQ